MVSAVWRGLVRYTAVLRSWAEISIFHPATAKYRGLRSWSCGPPALDRAHGHLWSILFCPKSDQSSFQHEM